ncbi:hypothetical protein CCACVL1_10721 [Corchorus capsularis]|uniref:Uncharacterized protein n=1 Tax=Corchorus capsularis TaxID=210143 RepID=A0A1R3IQ27_COCAP|nr:hypothetical protein CCACVL1_10721 [Corchorus capsularis]
MVTLIGGDGFDKEELGDDDGDGLEERRSG